VPQLDVGQKMKRIAIKIVIGVFLVLVAALTPLLTLGNSGWHIRRVFPTAKPYFDPVNSPDPTFSGILRAFIPTYFGFDESLGVRIEDSPTEIDLQSGFASIPHKSFFSMRVVRCKVINLCDTNQIGNPNFIVFEDCDFSALPEDQKARLRPYDPSNPEDKRLCIGSV
jgi:hypothetical protein